jgi:hypothetical protein
MIIELRLKMKLLATFLSLGIAVSLGAAPFGDASTAVTDGQVEHWLKTWQKRLALEEWEITAQVVRISELKPNTLGNLRWNSGAKTAVIHVLHPADYDLPASEIPVDMEYTVLHELVHLQLAALPRDPNARNVEERVVNKLSEALFALDKGAGYHARTTVAHIPSKNRSKSEASRSAY